MIPEMNFARDCMKVVELLEQKANRIEAEAKARGHAPLGSYPRVKHSVARLRATARALLEHAAQELAE